MRYHFEQLCEAYRQVGVAEQRVVMLRSDLRLLGLYDRSDGRDLLAAHYDALCEVMDLSRSTLVVCTSTHSLCNTDIPFDIDNTPSEMGVLSEYIRTRPGAIRSRHPFLSWTAIGREAPDICTDVARHGFGLETPKARMIERNAMYLSVGLPPNETASIIHHVEFLMGVPYRYVKEFIHPMLVGGQIVREPFYLYVWYRNIDFQRDHCRKIFKMFRDAGHTIRQAPLGNGFVYGYSMAELYHFAIQAFKKDLYLWMTAPPENPPYRI